MPINTNQHRYMPTSPGYDTTDSVRSPHYGPSGSTSSGNQNSRSVRTAIHLHSTLQQVQHILLRFENADDVEFKTIRFHRFGQIITRTVWYEWYRHDTYWKCRDIFPRLLTARVCTYSPMSPAYVQSGSTNNFSSSPAYSPKSPAYDQSTNNFSSSHYIPNLLHTINKVTTIRPVRPTPEISCVRSTR